MFESDKCEGNYKTLKICWDESYQEQDLTENRLRNAILKAVKAELIILLLLIFFTSVLEMSTVFVVAEMIKVI